MRSVSLGSPASLSLPDVDAFAFAVAVAAGAAPFAFADADLPLARAPLRAGMTGRCTNGPPDLVVQPSGVVVVVDFRREWVVTAPRTTETTTSTTVPSD